MVTRRSFIQNAAAAVGAGLLPYGVLSAEQVPQISAPSAGEDIFQYAKRVHGSDKTPYVARILGAANDFKEGDETVGVAAKDEASRRNARQLLANTRLADIDANPMHQDDLFRYCVTGQDTQKQKTTADWTCGELKHFLLTSSEGPIKDVMTGFSSDVISCVVKLMTNDELAQVGRTVFNVLPGSHIGAKGYLGARLQPNSPTDNVDDIRWQVLDGWSFAVGDVLLGTNPVSSDPASVAAIETGLQDLMKTFEIEHLMPHCVLAHIDVQAEVEAQLPGSTELWFQSVAGTDSANETFDISVEKMRDYARDRKGKYGLYFETGQGADFTNGHSHGFDMVMHESRKYGFARALTSEVSRARVKRGQSADAWVHVNDVAGFIGPEVFRTREQLVRCCLEDIVMGKLHGLCIGLDVCSTLHMDVSLDDLDWCLDQIMPANPGYLMSLPTKIDPMLGYLTTGFQDHVRLREKFDYKVNDGMWTFFQELGVIDANGKATQHFGDPVWVYLQFRRRKGDERTDQEIMDEGRQQLAEVRERGLFVAEGHGDNPWDLQPELNDDIHRIYDDAKLSIWAELKPDFISAIPGHLKLTTKSESRSDYILHPTSGEELAASSEKVLQSLRKQHGHRYDVQIVISDGLNALAIMEEGHLKPFLKRLRNDLENQGHHVAPENLVITSGRVRAGYQIGEMLFGKAERPSAIVHLIGERPGTGHRTFSTYITAPTGDVWGAGEADHNITKVVSGIASTALEPETGAAEVARLLETMMS